MATAQKPWPPKQYPTPEEQVFRPTLKDRTHQALRQVIDNKTDTLHNIARNTGLEWGWLRMFACKPSPDPGVNKIETLYHYLTGNTL